MKKILLAVIACAMSFGAFADEGMWLLPYLQKMNIKDMKAKGCKLTAEDIYSINHGSLKDAIIIFGGGCTGEIVSPEGLIFTNHHCGYSSIQELSAVEHDYLKNGFWAMSRDEEIPAPGLEIRFVRKIMDVTPDILSNIPSIASGDERLKDISVNRDSLVKRLSEEYPGMEISVKPFFGGNQYFAFVIEVYKDVRLVGTPPNSIGKFGGDTDNWMWPRHTCDFSVFRVYAGKDNRPAEYSADNVPYKADEYLKVSLDGYKPDDFGMIMGFPGSTSRYMTSYEIDNMLNISNPQRILIRGERQEILNKDMIADAKVMIQYASKYAMSSNYWKNSIGMSRGLKKLNVKAKKQAQEAEFQKWAEANTLPEEGYIDALKNIKEAVEANAENSAAVQYITEAAFAAIEIITPTSLCSRMTDTMTVDQKNMIKSQLADFYKDYNAPTDRKVARRMLTLMKENMKPEFLPDLFGRIDSLYGGNIDAYVDNIYDNSAFVDEQKAYDLVDNYSVDKLKSDPSYELFKSIINRYIELSQPMRDNNIKLADGQRLYIAGLMRMHPDKSWASDANFSIRLTYGQVLPYSPADGVIYDYYTTLKGVMDKEDLSNPEEFTVPEKLKELYAARDFGAYANDKGELPVAFLINCDITGGNSGSPVMNAKGELIGLAFDGNWEAMSGDVAFEPALQRTISVDIRYVLFIIDKYSGAGWLLDEMTINKSATKKTRK